MNRRLLFVFSLLLIAVLSACSVQRQGHVTTLPAQNSLLIEVGPNQDANILEPMLLADRKRIAEYQATHPTKETLMAEVGPNQDGNILEPMLVADAKWIKAYQAAHPERNSSAIQAGPLASE